jgi:alginate O-acetyltransferase complex protein AlgJ
MAGEIFRRGVLTRPEKPRFHRTDETVTGHPDLVRLLSLPTAGDGPLYEPVTVQVVRGADGAIFEPRGAYEAPILLLGDSLAGNYGWGSQGYGSGAGLAEQLAFHLQTPVQAILEPAGGPTDSREKLARRLRQGDDLLAGKRLVILEFAERELAIGPWRRAPLPPPEQD